MLVKFFEAMWFNPKFYHWIVSAILLPISLLLGLFHYFRRLSKQPIDYGLPIISIGNLIVGGSGKTPFIISISKKLNAKNIYIISRGYGRKSRGLLEVSRHGKILLNVEDSGDEAMLMANMLPNASVIVSEDRIGGINLAKQQGADLILLDDGFSKVGIEKFDLLLEPNSIKNYLPIPSGPFREFWFEKRNADLLLREDVDFSRVVSYEDVSSKMLLVTAISNPARLDKFLPNGVLDRYYFGDHAYFDESIIKQKMDSVGAMSILVTQKDSVKMRDFKLPISQIKLELDINNNVVTSINNYIKGYK